MSQTSQPADRNAGTENVRRRPWSLLQSVRFSLPIAWQTNPGLFVLMILASLGAALVSPFLALLTSAAVNEVQPALQGAAIDDARISNWLLLGALLGLALALSAALRKYTRQRLHDEVLLRVNHRVLSHAATLDLETREDTETQNCIRRATANPGAVVLNTTLGVINVVSATVQSGGLLCVLLWIEPVWSGLLVLLAIPHLTAQWFLSRQRHEVERSRTTSLRWSGYYHGLLAGHSAIASILTLRLAPWLLNRYRTATEDLLKASRRLYRTEALVNLASNLLTLLAVIGVLLAVGRAAMLGRVSTGEFVAFWFAAWRLQAALTRLAAAFADSCGAHFEVVNLKEFLNLAPRHSTQTGLSGKVAGAIDCVNLSYRYPGAHCPAVDGITVSIAAGETVAIVGPNGAGKSTLARLISGLYEPTSGELRVDGTPLSQWNRTAYYRQLALLPQDVFRLEATVHENIAAGCLEELLDSPDKVREVARMTGIGEFIERLPQGYNTHLGRAFGVTDLSGGQWRRLVVARCMASAPSILILDEPFSNLDPNAEEQLNRMFDVMLSSQTSILISHRYTLMQNVNRILVMNGGRLVETGTHTELLQRGGLYASMYRESTARYQFQSGQRNCKAA